MINSVNKKFRFYNLELYDSKTPTELVSFKFYFSVGTVWRNFEYNEILENCIISTETTSFVFIDHCVFVSFMPLVYVLVVYWSKIILYTTN